WAEQESHAFVFACLAPDLGALPESDRERCAAQLAELFNRVLPAGQPPDPGVLRFEVPEAADLGRLRVSLDRASAAGPPLALHVAGSAVGLEADRAAELYPLCFAHPAVRAIVWHGFWDGEESAGGAGLLRLDLAPRPAYRFLHKLIDTVWHTRASGETDADG